jgi:2-keto-4-pentenoate hydratase/2-oxohepta-3-ene-1,7-dioic acid hydratase in catechol pathway
MTAPDCWVRFESARGPRQGYVEGETIVPIAGDMFGDWRPEGAPVPLAGARLLAPVIPPTFYACGINYAGHWRTAAEEFGLDPEKSWPKYPEVGYRAQSAIVGPGDAIVLPVDVPPNVQVEGELAVVIGRRAKHVRPEDALDHVFGYTIGNDVSARGWQFADRTFWRSKNADTFKPLGPWIKRGVDLDSLVTRVSVNGEVRESFPTNKMIWSIADYIAAITRYITLVPGDVIIMGTDGHCPQLQPGDTVSIEIEGIGTLSNPVVGEA